MKIQKYLFVLAIAFSAMPRVCDAQNLQFLGGGTSALFVELGQAAATFIGPGACIWTSQGGATATDNRPPGYADSQGGPVWVVWDKGTTGADCQHPSNDFNVYSYLAVESVAANRCYFATDSAGVSGCTANIISNPSEAQFGANLLAPFNDSSPTVCGNTNPGSLCIIPLVVWNFLNGKRWFVAGTDIRPEDAKFQTLRMFTPCGQSLPRAPFQGGLSATFGLGYQTSTSGVGATVIDFYNSFSNSTLLDFNITGNDPITGKPVPSFTVSTVGAQPILVAVAPAGGTGIGAATDITTFTLANFYEGVLGRATDLVGPTTSDPITTLVREPLSGTYNNFEYSIASSSQFKGSQDDFNCNGNVAYSNPMNLASNAVGGLAFRRRVVGTADMITQLQNASSSDQRLGYLSWSAANASSFSATNGKYLTVNGVDPIQDAYSGAYTGQVPGQLPNATNGLLSHVTFKWLNMGDYPIWSALRLVTTNPAPPAVINLIAVAQTLNSTRNDFIPSASLKVWHSHFALPAINSGIQANGATINPATPNDLCNPSGGAILESGGDAGGSNVPKVANSDFCKDFNNQNGLINRNN